MTPKREFGSPSLRLMERRSGGPLIRLPPRPERVTPPEGPVGFSLGELA